MQVGYVQSDANDLLDDCTAVNSGICCEKYGLPHVAVPFISEGQRVRAKATSYFATLVSLLLDSFAVLCDRARYFSLAASFFPCLSKARHGIDRNLNSTLRTRTKFNHPDSHCDDESRGFHHRPAVFRSPTTSKRTSPERLSKIAEASTIYGEPATAEKEARANRVARPERKPKPGPGPETGTTKYRTNAGRETVPAVMFQKCLVPLVFHPP
jgi:hypothetical protein